MANAAEDDVPRDVDRARISCPTLHRLADLAPTTLALMHGSSFAGDGAAQLRSLADSYEERLAVIGGSAAPANS